MDDYWSCNVFGHSHAVCFQAWKVYVVVGHPWSLAKTLHVWPEGSGGLIGPKSMYPPPPCLHLMGVGGGGAVAAHQLGLLLAWTLLVGCGHVVTVALWCRYFKMLSRFGRECFSHRSSSRFVTFGMHAAVVEVVVISAVGGEVWFTTPQNYKLLKKTDIAVSSSHSKICLLGKPHEVEIAI